MRPRQQRTRQIIAGLHQHIRSDLKLLVYPALSSLLNSCILVLLFHPVYRYEVNRALHGGKSALTLVWFYALIAVFYLCRGCINAIFNSSVTAAVKLKSSQHPHYLSAALRVVAGKIPVLIAWTLFELVIAPLYFMVVGLQQNNQPKYVNGTHFMHCTFLGLTILVNEKISSLKALDRANSLLIATWGQPPLQYGFSVNGRFFAIACLLLLPALIALLFFMQIHWLCYTLLTISGVLFYLYSIYLKLCHDLIHQSLYLYATRGDISAPFNETTLRKAFISIN
jgi:hypothetical protein